MKVQVKMINVEDGDAIIVELFEGDKSAVILIDGGRKKYYKTRLQPTLAKVLKEQGKQGPDLVVCTHYDADHIEGLLEVVDEFGCNIKRLWVHPHPGEIKNQLVEIKETYANSLSEYLLRDIEQFKNYELLTEVFKDLKGFNRDGLNFIIESLGQLEDLFDKIDRINKKCAESGKNGIIVEHPVSEHYLEEWPDFKVEGPTEEYLQECFKTFKDKRAFLISEASFYPITDREKELMLLHEKSSEEEASPCFSLTTSSNISATNRSSIICSAIGEKGKYLFTGDAGVESFEAIPKWETELAELFWLDVPHHGSWNNTSKKMIDVFRPQFAFVSGNAGDNRPHWAVKACLEQKGAHVEVTNDPKNTIVLGIDTKGKTFRK